ncbi:hypothetical protein L0Z72_10105 [candidate division KSB1 bacterium]|nr:hypothetical protein [candidate division KSB1 bacterium]
MNTKRLLLLLVPLLCWSLIMIGCSKTITEPDPQFLKIHFYYGFSNELNTFKQTYTKDLVQDGYITVDFWLTEAEQERISNKLDFVDFFNFPDTLIYQIGPDSIMVRIEPDPGWQFLRVADENRDKIVHWRYPFPEENEFVPRLMELKNMIIEIIESKPEYRALPPAEGGRI